jgi:SAM-dependent methyltransferase
MIRKIVKQLDLLILGGSLRKIIFSKREKQILERRSKGLKYSMNLQYAKNDVSLLNTLCEKYGSDKGEVNSGGHHYTWPSHNYADFYDLIFGIRRHDVELVIECGLGTNNPNLASTMGKNGMPGASLRVWQDYFTRARIVGCDIDPETLFEENRISTYVCDQTDPFSIKNFILTAELKDLSVDVIIDDGLHKFHAGKCFFENMIKLLKADGIYVIEDVAPKDLYNYKEYFYSKDDTFEVRYVHLYSPQRSGGDNRLIVISKK